MLPKATLAASRATGLLASTLRAGYRSRCPHILMRSLASSAHQQRTSVRLQRRQTANAVPSQPRIFSHSKLHVRPYSNSRESEETESEPTEASAESDDLVVNSESTDDTVDEKTQAYRQAFARALNFAENEPDKKYHGEPLPDFMREHGSVLNMISMQRLVDAGVHYGHHKSYWNPLMEPYLYGVRDDVHIFDLEQTAVHLHRALDVLRHVAYQGGMILFISNRKQFERLVRYTAIGCGEYYVTEKWKGGCLSNSQRVREGTMLPDFAVLLTLPVSKGALYECDLMNVPSMAIVDSDQDPMSVTYTIPGNDDTLSAVEVYCDLMQKAVIEGKYCRANYMELSEPVMPDMFVGEAAETAEDA